MDLSHSFFCWNVPLALACSIPSVWQQTCEPLPISQQWSLISLPGLQSHPLVLKYGRYGRLQPAKIKSSFKMCMILYKMLLKTILLLNCNVSFLCQISILPNVLPVKHIIAVAKTR